MGETLSIKEHGIFLFSGIQLRTILMTKKTGIVSVQKVLQYSGILIGKLLFQVHRIRLFSFTSFSHKWFDENQTNS